ncbi:MAG: hypothetical protein V1861_03730 [Candidatus Micrarchaeota archaeon]
MAGSASMLNPIHAARESGRPRFRQPALVEASLTMLGRTFTTTIHEGATTNELIEKVARENGGDVTRRYYPEFKTWEIVSVRIGDSALVKSSESGIHFSLGSAGIPMALTQEQGIVFPNAEELRIGRNTRNIALWTTSANFDPGSIGDLDRMYSGRGGVALSKDARDEISKAHGGIRSGNGILLEENILVLNKDTGEILTVSQHAAKEPESIAFSGGAIQIAYQSYIEIQPAFREIIGFDPGICDAFRSRMTDAKSIIIKTFDGSIADSVTVRFNPFSQDVRETILPALPQALEAIASDSLRPQALASAPAQRLSFCLLAFGTVLPTAASSQAQEYPLNPRPSTSMKQTTRPGPSSHEAIPVLRQKRAMPGRQELPAAPSFESAYRAWKAPRFISARLDVPTGFQKLEKPGKKKGGRDGDAQTRERLREKIQSIINLAAKMLSILKLIQKTARMAAQKTKSEVPIIQKRPKYTLKGSLRGKRTKPSGAENAKSLKPEGLPAKKAKETEQSKLSSRKRKAAAGGSARYPRAFLTSQTTWARAPSPRLGGKKKLPAHFFWEMLGLHWKKRGRKFRMKKNSAP